MPHRRSAESSSRSTSLSSRSARPCSAPARSATFGSNAQALGFLADIIANRDDDSPRLIFADWLEDQGHPERAEFIRLQIQGSRCPSPEARSKELEKKERALLRRFAGKWFAPPRGWLIGTHCWIHRGFPDHLAVDANSFFAHADDVFARWPIVDLGLSGLTPALVQRLADWPQLARIRSLELVNQHLGATGLRILWQSPWLTNLSRLDLSNTALGDAGAEAVAHCSALAGLRELDVRHNEVTAQGQRELIRSKHRRHTTALCLCGNTVRPEDAVAFLESADWPALTNLSLWNTRQNDEGVQQLAASPALLKLTALNLNLNNITDTGLQALAGSPYAANLRTLLLAANNLTSKSGPMLMRSPYLQELTRLNLHGNDALHWQTRRKLREHFGDRVSFVEPW